MRIYEDTIHVQYSQVYVQAGSYDFSCAQAFAGQANGLCGATAGELCMQTASSDGPLHFVVEVLDDEPAIDPLYGDVVEVSFAPLTTTAALVALMGGPGGCDFELDQPCYRVRYSVKNADEALQSLMEAESEEEYDVHLDEYLLQFWPAAQASDRIIAQSSAWALARHEEVDGTAERRRAAEAAAPNPLRDAEPHARHAALVWLVQQAGARTGIADDPLFIRAIADSWDVLAEFEASGREPHDLYFISQGLPAYRRALEAALPALSRWELVDRHKVRNKGFESNPIWHRYQAWLAVDGLLCDPFTTWDEINRGAQVTVEHAKYALQEDWPGAEQHFLKLLSTR